LVDCKIIFLDFNRYGVSYLHSSNIVRSAVFYLHIQYICKHSLIFIIFISTDSNLY